MNPKIASYLAVLLVLATAVGPVGAASDAAQGTCEFPVTETDATGTEVTIAEEPTRIVTLSPSAAQTMWEIGGRDKVVGVSRYASYLEGADSRTNVSGSGSTFVNAEAVVSLEPDLVLAPNVIPDETVERLREAGLTVYKFEFASSVEDVYAKTELTGRLTGECAGAAETVSWMKSEIATVEKAVKDEKRPRALYVSDGFTAGEGTFIDEIIEAGGGANVAAEANVTGYGQLSEEVVVQRNPEWLVLNSDGPTVPQSAGFNGTDAVKRNQTVVLNADYLSQPGPRVVYPIKKLARTFHPEAYAAANGTEAPNGTTTPDATETPAGDSDGVPQGGDEGATESSGQAGFGAPLAATALALLALLARRD